jgi:hypothetical protein
MKNSNDKIGNRTRVPPKCSVVPQPNAPPCAPESTGAPVNFKNAIHSPSIDLVKHLSRRPHLKGGSLLAVAKGAG